MSHLISDFDLSRIENSLLLRRDQIVQATSWTFNMILLGLVLSGFVYFLYVQYNSHQTQEDEEKRIPFTPTTWYSATRNVRSEEYGRQLQPFETETRYGIQGLGYGGSAETF
jgi:hypothetical protein